jgi:DNA-binding transcriptional ArsR family regulator
MTLCIEGDRKRIAEYLENAKKDGLKIRLYSDETNLPIFSGSSRAEIAPSEYSGSNMRMMLYLQKQQALGKSFVPQSDFVSILKMPKSTVSSNMKKLNENGIISIIPMANRKGRMAKLLKSLSADDFEILSKEYNIE